MNKSLIENRFKQIMLPSVLMGVLYNIGLAELFYFINAFDAITSPLIGSLLFLVYFFLLKKDMLTSKQVSLIVAYTVVVEIFIHSYCLGWGMGFYYYMFLLPVIFLLNSSWKTWIIVFFNSSIAVLSVLFWFFVYGENSVYPVHDEVRSYVNLFNLTCAGTVIFVVTIYFSRTINSKDEVLLKVNLELEIQNKEIIGQRENLEVLLKEVHHRVKNNLQIISSLMSLERGTIENNEVIRILDESKRRVEAIALIHQKLYQGKGFDRVDFHSYLEEIVSNQKIINPGVECRLESPIIILDLDTAVPLGLIISELITNAIKHAFETVKNPILKIVLLKSGRDFDLLVSDNGAGLAEDFDISQPNSLGLEIITALTEQIDGKIECFNNDGGATFKVSLKNKLIDVA